MDVALLVLLIVVALVGTLLVFLLGKLKEKSEPEDETPPAAKSPLPSAASSTRPAASQSKAVSYNGVRIYQYSQTASCRKCSSCGCENKPSQAFCEVCGCRL